jgi:hypothetical protein
MSFYCYQPIRYRYRYGIGKKLQDFILEIGIYVIGTGTSIKNYRWGLRTSIVTGLYDTGTGTGME